MRGEFFDWGSARRAGGEPATPAVLYRCCGVLATAVRNQCREECRRKNSAGSVMRDEIWRYVVYEIYAVD